MKFAQLRRRAAVAADMRAVAALLVVLAGLAAAAPAGAFPGDNGTLVYGWSSLMESELGPPFTSEEETAIKTISPRGGTPTTLRGCVRATGEPDVGDCSIGYADPAVSPDGRRIAFDAGASLALMRIDGGGYRLLPAHSEDDGEPAFSPGGARVAFSAGASTAIFDPTPDRGVWIAALAGGQARQVTARGTSPAWSTRNWIAFVRANGIYRVRPDGRGLRRLVARERCTDVAWSPEGTRLAFACRGRLWVADGDGGDARRVAGASADDVAWAPDGRRLVVHPFDSGVTTMRPDGSRVRDLVPGGTGATYRFGANGVDWQPLRSRR